jgi:hypothetical protein
MTAKSDQRIREKYGDVVVASPSENRIGVRANREHDFGEPPNSARCLVCGEQYPPISPHCGPFAHEFGQGSANEIANDVFICGHDFGCNRHSERVANWCCPRKYPLHEDGCKNKAQATDTTNYAGKAAQDAPPAPREQDATAVCRCGHALALHDGTDGKCIGHGSMPGSFCGCRDFRVPHEALIARVGRALAEAQKYEAPHAPSADTILLRDILTALKGAQ